MGGAKILGQLGESTADHLERQNFHHGFFTFGAHLRHHGEN
jgi:hypothetical protein